MSQILMTSELISPLFTQETDVSANPFSTSVHQQPGASGSEQQAASLCVINPWHMLNVGSCQELQQVGESSVVRSCGKLQQSVDSNEKIPVERKETFCLSDKTFMNTLKKKPGELFKVDVWLREDSLKLKSKWTGKVGREETLIWLNTKPIVNMNHSPWSKPLGWRSLTGKPKNIRRMSNEEQTSSRKSRQRLL